MIRVYIATDATQYIPLKVLAYSIKVNSSEDVSCEYMYPEYTGVGSGTSFNFMRFLVPSKGGFEGKAIYLDADQLVLGNISELFHSLDSESDVGLVYGATGYTESRFGYNGLFGRRYPITEKMESSVMVLNCKRLKDWIPDVLYERALSYRVDGIKRPEWFLRLGWMDKKRIQFIAPEWNHINLLNEQTKLVHFSRPRTQPWKIKTHSLTSLWMQWLERAVNEGYVLKEELVREVKVGHVGKHLLDLTRRRG